MHLAIFQAINNLISELEVSTGSFLFEHDVNDISDMCTSFSSRGTGVVDVGNNSTSCFGHTDGSFVSEVCGHGFCGCKTRSLTDKAYAYIASGNFRNFVLSSNTAISYEERLACFDTMSFKTVHDCRDNDIVVSLDCSTGKTVSCEYNNLRSFLEAFEFLNGFLAESSAKVRSGKISIFAVAARLELKNAALFKEFLRELVEYCVLCSSMVSTETEHSVGHFTSAAVPYAKTCRSNMFKSSVLCFVLCVRDLIPVVKFVSGKILKIIIADVFDAFAAASFGSFSGRSVFHHFTDDLSDNLFKFVIRYHYLYILPSNIFSTILT